MITVDSMFVV